MVDASAVKQKVKNMPKRSKALAHIPSHKHCRVCGIDISAKAEERVCNCIKKYEKDEKNKERMRVWMLIFFGIFAFLTILPVLARLV